MNPASKVSVDSIHHNQLDGADLPSGKDNFWRRSFLELGIGILGAALAAGTGKTEAANPVLPGAAGDPSPVRLKLSKTSTPAELPAKDDGLVQARVTLMQRVQAIATLPAADPGRGVLREMMMKELDSKPGYLNKVIGGLAEQDQERLKEVCAEVWQAYETSKIEAASSPTARLIRGMLVKHLNKMASLPAGSQERSKEADLAWGVVEDYPEELVSIVGGLPQKEQQQLKEFCPDIQQAYETGKVEDVLLRQLREFVMEKVQKISSLPPGDRKKDTKDLQKKLEADLQVMVKTIRGLGEEQQKQLKEACPSIWKIYEKNKDKFPPAPLKRPVVVSAQKPVAPAQPAPATQPAPAPANVPPQNPPAQPTPPAPQNPDKEKGAFEPGKILDTLDKADGLFRKIKKR